MALRETGVLKLPQSRSGKVYSCIPTLSTPVASPARPVERSAVATMHPEKYLPELVAEKNSLDPSFVHAVRLLAEGKSGVPHSELCTLVYQRHSPCSLQHCMALWGEAQWPDVGLFQHTVLESYNARLQ